MHQANGKSDAICDVPAVVGQEWQVGRSGIDCDKQWACSPTAVQTLDQMLPLLWVVRPVKRPQSWGKVTLPDSVTEGRDRTEACM